jgi:receptor protein-tyrosine kinase
MRIIEEAHKRLQELARAGIEVPKTRASGLPGGPNASLGPDSGSFMAARASSGDAERRSNGRTIPEGGFGKVQASSAVESVIIDLTRLESMGYIVPTSARAKIAQEFRHIKRPILQNARGRDALVERKSLIMVTSALPGEGKTFVSINLAMSIAAEVDTAVILVDADVVVPQVLERLGIAPRPGLLDLLTNPSTDLTGVLMATNVPKLSILSAGAPNDFSAELLASDAMEQLLASLVRRFPGHVVIFDAPPLLVTNEAKVLAAHVGQVLLVVEASRTPRESVELAFDSLEECPVVMSVLNRADGRAGSDGYGYTQG